MLLCCFQVDIVDMSEFKLDVTIHGDSDVSESSSFNGDLSLSETGNGLYRMLNGVQKQGYGVISNFATNPRRMGLTER